MRPPAWYVMVVSVIVTSLVALVLLLGTLVADVHALREAVEARTAAAPKLVVSVDACADPGELAPWLPVARAGEGVAP